MKNSKRLGPPGKSSRLKGKSRPTSPDSSHPYDFGSSFKDDVGLPGCVEVALEIADVLEEAVFEPFPDLESGMTFSNDKDAKGGFGRVRSRIEEACTWADMIVYICKTGTPLRGPNDPRRRFARVSLALLFKGRGDRASIGFARDVLGDPPSTLQRCCSAAILLDMRPYRTRDPFPQTYPGEYPDDVTALWLWHGRLRDEVAQGYRTIRSQALSLVAWIRDGADRHLSATFPTIQLPPEGKSRECTAMVTIAGRRTERIITKTHRQFLAGLAGKGEETADRNKITGNRPGALEHRIPELRGLIETVRGSSTENGALFRISAALKARISVTAAPSAR